MSEERDYAQPLIVGVGEDADVTVCVTDDFAFDVPRWWMRQLATDFLEMDKLLAESEAEDGA